MADSKPQSTASVTPAIVPAIRPRRVNPNELPVPVLPIPAPIVIEDDQVQVDAAAEAALKHLGYDQRIRATTVKALHDVGLAINHGGAVVNQHGEAFLTQENLRELMDTVTKNFRELDKQKLGDKKINRMVKLAGIISSLARVRVLSHKTVFDQAGSVVAPGQLPPPPPAINKSFAKGQIVGMGETKVLAQPGSTVNINQGPEQKQP